MPILILTNENVSFLKKELRGRLPKIASGHLTEAIAAALGFRTHASLLVEMREPLPARPAFAWVDERRFFERLLELGYRSDGPGLLTDIVRSAGLPDSAWCEFRNQDDAANNRWYRECQRRGIPNVYIRLRTKYAELCWDCISIEPPNDEHTYGDEGTALGAEMFKRYQKRSDKDPGKSEFLGSSFVGHVDRLLPSVARDLADDFFVFLYAPMVAMKRIQASLSKPLVR